MKPLVDKLLRYMEARHIPPRRFFASMALAIFVTLVGAALMLSDLDAFDYDLPPYQPNTVSENIIMIVSVVILDVVGWPFLVTALIGGDRLVGGLCVPLLIFTGLFWAFVIESIFAIKRRRQSKARPDSN
jgi:hypothetical protein